MFFLLFLIAGIAIYYVGRETFKETIQEFQKAFKPKKDCVIIQFTKQQEEKRGVRNV